MDQVNFTRPLLGRWINFQVQPARPLTLLGPAWAAMCGALASGANLRGQFFLFSILAIFLCDALLGAWRALWLESDWRAARQRLSASAATWLDVSPEAAQSFFARARERTARWFAYTRQIVWPMINSEIVSLGMVGLFTLSVAIVLGTAPLALTAAAMALVIFENQADRERGASVRALIEIAFPWLIAQSAFGFFSWLALFYILLCAIIYRALLGLAATRQARWIKWSNLAHLAIILALIAANAPIPAGVAALGLLAQILWQARYQLDRDGIAYARRVQSYVMMTMLMIALALWL